MRMEAWQRKSKDEIVGGMDFLESSGLASPGISRVKKDLMNVGVLASI